MRQLISFANNCMFDRIWNLEYLEFGIFSMSPYYLQVVPKFVLTMVEVMYFLQVFTCSLLLQCGVTHAICH